MKRILKLKLTKRAKVSGLAEVVALSLEEHELINNETIMQEMVSYVPEIRKEMRELVYPQGWRENDVGMSMAIFSPNPLQFIYELRFEKNADPVPAPVED